MWCLQCKTWSAFSSDIIILTEGVWTCKKCGYRHSERKSKKVLWDVWAGVDGAADPTSDAC